MKIGPFTIHRKEQDDIGCVPLVCVHRREPNSRTRVFCLWTGGVQVGSRQFIRRDVERRILRPYLNAFAKEVVNAAKERGAINSTSQHALAGIIDRRLWPERYDRSTATQPSYDARAN